MTTLVVTNDFPPTRGGIETYAAELVARLAGPVVVHASRRGGLSPAMADADAALAAACGVVVVRDRARILLPTPAVTRRVVATARANGCDRAWFAAAAPLALMAPSLRAAGVRRVVASTHGHEVWWATLPGTRAALRRIAAGVDVLTAVAGPPRSRIAAALPTASRARLADLPPGVDARRFCPRVVGDDEVAALRARYGLAGRPVVVCVGRLVARKGQDALLRALPRVRAAVPGAVLLLVGDGPDRRRLQRLARRLGLGAGAVVLAGTVPDAALPAHYAVADVFAMASRTRLGGLQTEGFGIAFLEAAASGLPVVAGRCGGSGEAVQDGVTGLLVDGRDDRALADALVGLLTDPARAAAMGRAGRAWVLAACGWDERARELQRMLEPQLR